MKYSSFEDMPVWQIAMDLVAKIFTLTGKLPRKENYGLTSQMRNSALSVSGNIAEGFGRIHIKEAMLIRRNGASRVQVCNLNPNSSCEANTNFKEQVTNLLPQ